MPYSRRKAVAPLLLKDRTSSDECADVKTKISVNQSTQDDDNHIEDGEDEKGKVIEHSSEKQRSAGNRGTSALYPSLETSYDFPHKEIKLEDDCLSDIYNISDRGYVKKTFSIVSRDRSKSIAQLSTPVASRPTSIAGDQESILKGFFLKYENDQSYIGEGKALHNKSTPPASSPKRCASPTRRQKPIPFILQQNSTYISPSPAMSHDRLGSCIFLDEYSMNTRKRISKEGNKTSSFDLEPKNGEVWKVINERGIQHPATSATSPKGISWPEPLPVLSPANIRNISEQSSSTSAPIAFRLAKLSTPDRPITIEENARNHTPDSLKKRDDVSRLRNPKSISLCPTFASFFGSDDNIPCSKEMKQEAVKAIADSTNRFVAMQLSKMSPSLRKRRVSPSIRDDRSTQADEDSRDIYTNDGNDDYLQLTPEPQGLLRKFGQETNNVKKRIEIRQDLLSQGERVMHIGKKIPHPFPQRVQLLSKAPGMFNAIRSDSERNRLEYLDFSEDEDASDRSESHDSSRPIARFHENGCPDGPGNDRYMKRARTESIGWHPGLFFENETLSDEEIVEIGREDFEKSERNKPKRRKVNDDEIREYTDAKNLEPRESLDAEQNMFCEKVKECQTTAVTNYEIRKVTQRRLSTHDECEYNMHSYFDHGQSNAGRLAREGFICYIDFRKYCKESSQPVKDTFTRFKKDLKHILTCQDHQARRPDLFKIALFVELTPGFVLKSCHPNEEVRRREDESIGNAPKSPVRNPAPGVDAEKLEALERESRYKEVLIAELLKKVKDMSAAEKRTRRIMGAGWKPARRARQRT